MLMHHLAGWIEEEGWPQTASHALRMHGVAMHATRCDCPADQQAVLEMDTRLTSRLLPHQSLALSEL